MANREGFREGQPEILPLEIRTNSVSHVSQTKHRTSRRQVSLDEEVAMKWLNYLQQAYQDSGVLKAGGKIEIMIKLILLYSRARLIL